MAERQKEMGIIVKHTLLFKSYTRYHDAEKVLELRTIPST